jgi:hypothetical protein
VKKFKLGREWEIPSVHLGGSRDPFLRHSEFRPYQKRRLKSLGLGFRLRGNDEKSIFSVTIQLDYSLLRRGDELMGGGGINSQTLEVRHCPPIAMLLRFEDAELC